MPDLNESDGSIRPDLQDLTSAQLAPIEQRFNHEWPEAWRDFARSAFITLLYTPGETEEGRFDATAAADLAVALTHGIAQDLGGSQPYISVGTQLMRSAKAHRIVQLLARGEKWAAVAHAVGVGERQVRRIHTEWSRREADRRQPKLF